MIRTRPAWVGTLLCWLIVMLDGYDLIAYGTTLPSLLQEPGWNLTATSAGFIGSVAFVGMLIGALGAGYFADRLGRRGTILWCTVWFSRVAPAEFGWRSLYAVAFVALVILVPLCIAHLPESPTWLRAHGRTDEAARIEHLYRLDPVYPEPGHAGHKPGFAAILSGQWRLPTTLRPGDHRHPPRLVRPGHRAAQADGLRRPARPRQAAVLPAHAEPRRGPGLRGHRMGGGPVRPSPERRRRRSHGVPVLRVRPRRDQRRRDGHARAVPC